MKTKKTKKKNMLKVLIFLMLKAIRRWVFYLIIKSEDGFAELGFS